MTKDIFAVKKTAQKVQNEIDKMKISALVEIGRNPTILRYFNYLIEGYNKNIISSSKPDILEKNKTQLIEWHAKKEQIEGLLTAASEIKRK